MGSRCSHSRDYGAHWSTSPVIDGNHSFTNICFSHLWCRLRFGTVLLFSTLSLRFSLSNMNVMHTKTLYTCYSYNDSCQCQNATVLVQLLQWSYLTLRHGYQVPLRSKNRDLKGPPVDEPGNREHEFPRIIFTTCSLGKSLMLSHIL